LRRLFPFLILNVIVTFAVAYLVISITDRLRSPNANITRVPPLIVVVTATPNPNEPTTTPWIITTTPDGSVPGRATRSTGSGTASGTVSAADAANTAVSSVASVGTSTVPPLDPSLLPPSVGELEPPTFTPTDESGCPTHTIAEGEFAGGIAVEYGVTVEELMAANDLTEDDLTRLQIGQVLIIPVDGCGLPETSPTPTDTPTPQTTSTREPTVTLQPTATAAKIEIVQVFSPGDVTAEGVEIRNISGSVIDIEGWTLSGRGNTYTFPAMQLFDTRRIILYTSSRTGAGNTPLVLYWGLQTPLWGDPETEIVIADADGVEQLRYSRARGVISAGQ
jgi:LysM repeat protein